MQHLLELVRVPRHVAPGCAHAEAGAALLFGLHGRQQMSRLKQEQGDSVSWSSIDHKCSCKMKQVPSVHAHSKLSDKTKAAIHLAHSKTGMRSGIEDTSKKAYLLRSGCRYCTN